MRKPRKVFYILAACCIAIVIGTVVFFIVNKENNTQNYISISSTFDSIRPGNTDITIYDKNFKELSKTSIDFGGVGTGLIDHGDKIYLFGGRSYIMLNKKTGEYKEYEDIMDCGVIEAANGMSETPVFVKNIGLTSATDYDCEICEIDDLDNPKVTSFKTQNTFASDAIKFNNKIYAATSSAGKDNNFFIEIYDSNHKLIVKNKIYTTSGVLRFYVNNDILYLISNMGSITSIYKVSEEGNIEIVPIKGFDGYYYINPLNNNIYSSSSSGHIRKISLNGDDPEEILDINSFMPPHETEYDFTSNVLFYDNTFAVRSVIRLPVSENAPTGIKVYVPSGNTYKESEVLSKQDAANAQQGKRLVYFGEISEYEHGTIESAKQTEQ